MRRETFARCQLRTRGDRAAVGDVRFPAARRLGACEQGVQERAPRVRIHLDQLGAIVSQMKIIAHESAAGPKVPMCDGRCPGHDRVAVNLIGCGSLNRFDNGHHRSEILFGEEDRVR
jgi:hypothetical protein